MSDDKFVNPIPQLLVTEAIHEFEKKFENMTDKNTHVELNICNLGIKTGFAMASQICRRDTTEIESLDDICKFLAGRFTQSLFNVSAAKSLSTQKVLNITFSDKLPSWFNSIITPGSQQQSPESIFWFRSYAYFLLGLYQGALLHFGYKATPALDKQPPILSLLFRLEALEGSWEFMSSTKY